MIRQFSQIDPTLQASLHFVFGHCPAHCNDGSKFHGPTGITYRSSKRSLTLRCSQCGLLWTMTVHQIAKAAKRLQARYYPDQPTRQWVAAWTDWADAVDDQRGKKKKKPKGAR